MEMININEKNKKIKEKQNIDKIVLTGEESDSKFEYASQWQLMWWRFKKHKAAMFSSVIIIILYLTAIFAGFVAPYGPNERNSGLNFAPPMKLHFVDEEGFHFRPFAYSYKQKLDPETFERIYKIEKSKKLPLYFFVYADKYKMWGVFETNFHLFGTKKGEKIFLFGTDEFGRDLFTRIIYGGQISMSIGLVGVFSSFILGLILGGISGYFGGAADNIIQRGIEIVRSFPRIPLWMCLSAALPYHWSSIKIYFSITIILSIIGWTGIARVARSKILSLKNEDFVIAARLAGMGEAKIIARHLIPSFMSHIIATITLWIPQMILGETALSFLGIGLRSPAISWGVLLQAAQNVHAVALAPWLLIPGFFVIIFVLSFNFLGDGLRDAADPYSI